MRGKYCLHVLDIVSPAHFSLKIGFIYFILEEGGGVIIFIFKEKTVPT